MVSHYKMSIDSTVLQKKSYYISSPDLLGQISIFFNKCPKCRRLRENEWQKHELGNTTFLSLYPFGNEWTIWFRFGIFSFLGTFFCALRRASRWVGRTSFTFSSVNCRWRWAFLDINGLQTGLPLRSSDSSLGMFVTNSETSTKSLIWLRATFSDKSSVSTKIIKATILQT